MVALLELVRIRSETHDQFMQTRSIDVGESRLAQLSPGGQERFLLHARLGADYRRVGNIAKSIEHMQLAEKFQAESGLTNQPRGARTFLMEMAITYLRQAETENCIHCRTGESCILPIRPGGIHQKRTGGRKSMEYLRKVLDLDPDDLPAKWLLNVAAMTLGEFPQSVPPQFRLPDNAFQDDSKFPRFIDIAEEVGLKSISCGGGAVAEDFDNDGFIDILTSSWDPATQIRYFRNTGEGKFEDQTISAGLTGLLGGINLVAGDYDNDGDVDVFITRGAWLSGEAGYQPSSLVQNLGNGKFRDVTFELGLGEIQAPCPTAAWDDYDNDGDLDLYIGHEGPPCQLYRNDGSNGFSNVTQEAGVENGAFTKAVLWGDYNADGRPDLYVSNLQADNRLYRNNGDGTFTDVAPALDVVKPFSSFGAWFWDINNDGRQDLFVGSYNVGVQNVAADFFGAPRTDEPDCLYLGNSDSLFTEVSAEYGLRRATQPMGVNFGDLDNDGYLDFYLGTGYPEYEGLMPNLMFRNREGKGFEEVTFSGGFGHLQKGHGIAFADLDNDGDQDIFINMGGAYRGDAFGDILFENPGFQNNWIRIKLKGVRSNRTGIGARIHLRVTDQGTTRSIYRWVNTGATFGSNPIQPQIGVGRASQIDLLQIDWPATGTQQRFEAVPVNTLVEIQEDQNAIQHIPLKRIEFAKLRKSTTSISK